MNLDTDDQLYIRHALENLMEMKRDDEMLEEAMERIRCDRRDRLETVQIASVIATCAMASLFFLVMILMIVGSAVS